MSANWHIGMEVECIDDEGFRPFIRQGEKYTVTAVVPWHGYFKGVMCSFQAIELAETYNPSDEMDPDAPRGFASLRFRPVQKRSTSIEAFNKILLNPRIPIREDA